MKRELYVDCGLFMQIIYFSFIHSFITYVLHILHKLNIMDKFNHMLNIKILEIGKIYNTLSVKEVN